MESTRFNWTWDEKDILDLTEENVQKVFQSCLATLNTKTEDIVESSFMDDSSAIKSRCQ